MVSLLPRGVFPGGGPISALIGFLLGKAVDKYIDASYQLPCRDHKKGHRDVRWPFLRF